MNLFKIYKIIICFLAFNSIGCVNLNSEFYSNMHILSLKNNSRETINYTVFYKEKLLSSGKVNSELIDDIYLAYSAFDFPLTVTVMDGQTTKSYIINADDFKGMLTNTKTIIWE